MQVVVWQEKFYSKKFCVTCSGSLDFNGGDGISYKGDNSTLAPAFPVLSVGFISSDIESVICCHVRWVSWMVHTSMPFCFWKF